ncbi:tyrosine-type recombinase/integrase [Thermomonospora amylolytica]|uniref:tyrosine-type recombinase/integrase n=1 Tax=Thermomonospora amylolytica TaxID=1411117 RepID=UPI001300AAD8|nr:tyrosine-type recombinase/integrase [Thermomonospora amylolytica]
MIESQDIQFWGIRKRNRRKPFEVRWRVNTSPFSRSFVTKALAENYRAKLMAAARNGEVFSLTTGEPVNWERKAETVYQHAREFIWMRWSDGGAANTRAALVRSLVPITLATLDPRASKRGRPDDAVLRKALASWAFRPPAWEMAPPPEITEALEWVASASRPVAALDDPGVIREVLRVLALRLDGKPLVHTSMRARRSALYALLDYAVERKLLGSNPVTGVKVRRRRVSDRIDPRRVPNLAQARALLAAVPKRDGHLAAFFAVLYYAGTRPGEARALRAADCVLPATGWGTLMLSANRPEVHPDWTDDGDRYTERELKHRAPGEVRPVPIPPVLVATIRAHIDTYGTAPDGRLFWEGEDRRPVSGQTYRRAWRRMRKAALSAPQLASDLAARPYDLRHGNASLLLNNGVPATEVARRLGHSVAMLHTTYAHWFEGLEAAANARIDAALAADDAVTSENSGHGPTVGHAAS